MQRACRFAACTHSYPRVQLKLSVKEQTKLHEPKCKASVFLLGKPQVLERNSACCKAPLHSAAVDSSESLKRFSLTIALQILHSLIALLQWWFLVLTHLTAPSCFKGSFRAQLTQEKKLAPAMQGGGDLGSQFQKRLRDFGCSNPAESEELLFTAACEKPTGTT